MCNDKLNKFEHEWNYLFSHVESISVELVRLEFPHSAYRKAKELRLFKWLNAIFSGLELIKLVK